MEHALARRARPPLGVTGRARTMMVLYGAGGLATTGYFAWQAIEGGALSRPHEGLRQWLIIAAFYGLIGVFWPVFWVFAALVILGWAKPIDF